MPFIFHLFLALFLCVCLLLCLVILVQESKSLGLGSSFGGDSGASLFGTSTADVLRKITAWLSVAFMGISLFLSLWVSQGKSVRAPKVPTEMVPPEAQPPETRSPETQSL